MDKDYKAFQDPSKTFFCSMCYETYEKKPNGKLYTEYEDDLFIKTMKQCGHSFCSACFKTYYTDLITNQYRHEFLCCPEQGCKSKPTEKEIEEIVGVGCYKKFKRFKLNTLVARD